MATAAKAAQYPHIVKTAGIRGGKARIDGTRICVVDIVAAHQQGIEPKEILTYFSSRPLTLAEVYSALAYYHDHADEIDAYFEASRKAAEEIAPRDPAPGESPR
jgi:uncharacterized protein (DUF433 family)